MLNRIKYTSIKAEHYITTIFGLPFYQSSGINSFAPGTWFPFYGISDKDIELDDVIIAAGWFIKSAEEDINIPYSIKDDIREAFRFKSDKDQFADNLIGRFATLPCLLISSVLGCGIWETRQFKNLKQDLMKKYPDFYTNFPKLEFSPSILNVDARDNEVEKLHEVNNWLIDNSINKNIKTVEDFKKENLNTLENLKPYEPIREGFKIK